MLAAAVRRPRQPEVYCPNVEVFRTTVRSARHAAVVIALVQAHFPSLRVTMDLDDCDKVLRVQSSQAGVRLPIGAILHLVSVLGFEIEALAD